MAADLERRFRLGPFEVEPLRGAIDGIDGQSHHLEPKVMDVFVLLAQHSNEVVTREYLLEKVWTGQVAADELLTRAISELRRVLGNDPDYIETVPKRGYRLIGEISFTVNSPSAVGMERIDRAIRLNRPYVAVIAILALVSIYALLRQLPLIGPAIPVIQQSPSVAVLPFVNVGSNPEQEIISDGISDDILNLLAQTHELQVRGRTSSYRFKDSEEDISTIGNKLNVSHVLEGSVRRIGKSLRITASLTDVSSGFSIWADQYDRSDEQLIEIQKVIATDVAKALNVIPFVSDEPDAGSPETSAFLNIDAYRSYLIGRQLIRNRGNRNINDAIEHLEHSINLDYNFAPAHAQIAIGYALLQDTRGNTGSLTREEVWQKAVTHLDEAEKLQPELADIYSAWSALYLDSDLNLAIEYAQRALDINPGDINSLNWIQFAYQELGRYEDSVRILEEMMFLDPAYMTGLANYISWLGNSGRVTKAHELADQLMGDNELYGVSRHAFLSFFREGKISEGFEWSLRQYSIDSSFIPLAMFYTFVYLEMYDEARRRSGLVEYVVDLRSGQHDEAAAKLVKDVSADPENEIKIGRLAELYYQLGRFEDSLAQFEKLTKFRPDGHLINSSWLTTARYAVALDRIGNTRESKSVIEIVRKDIRAFRSAGGDFEELHDAEALIYALEDNFPATIDAITTALKEGHRNPHFFEDPAFDHMRNRREFRSLSQNLAAMLHVEHEKVLEIVCFKNPIPDVWKPLEETCKGV